jgi:hypothetical protein
MNGCRSSRWISFHDRRCVVDIDRGDPSLARGQRKTRYEGNVTMNKLLLRCLPLLIVAIVAAGVFKPLGHANAQNTPLTNPNGNPPSVEALNASALEGALQHADEEHGKEKHQCGGSACE